MQRVRKKKRSQLTISYNQVLKIIWKLSDPGSTHSLADNLRLKWKAGKNRSY